MKKWLWFLLVVVIVALDQATKYWALLTLMPYQPVAVMPMLNFTLAYNTGAAFSFLSSTGEWHRWFFTVFSAVMATGLLVWIIRLAPEFCFQRVALSLILGGAIGNLIDRAFLGYVIDFIDVFYKNHHWPVFNIADSAICLGACLLFIELCKSNSTDRV